MADFVDYRFGLPVAPVNPLDNILNPQKNKLPLPSFTALPSDLDPSKVKRPLPEASAEPTFVTGFQYTPGSAQPDWFKRRVLEGVGRGDVGRADKSPGMSAPPNSTPEERIGRLITRRLAQGLRNPNSVTALQGAGLALKASEAGYAKEANAKPTAAESDPYHKKRTALELQQMYDRTRPQHWWSGDDGVDYA